MYKTKVHLISLEDNLSFEVSVPDKESLDTFLFTAFGIFLETRPGVDEPILEGFQRNTLKVRKHFDELADQLKTELPAIQTIPAFFRRLKDDEAFIVLPGYEIGQKGALDLRMLLQSKAEGRPLEEVRGPMDALFKELLGKYRVSRYGDKKQRIGTSKKQERICRFCERGMPQVTFKQVAHAISESLGNKTLILHDECDECNARFSSDIEADIIEFFSIFIGFFGIRGKKGNRTAKGHNFILKHGELHPEITLIDGEKLPNSIKSYRLVLKGKVPISLNAVYRCLCKYVLSVLPANELEYFHETLAWVNTGHAERALPVMSQLISYHAFTNQPKMVLYLRDTDDTQLPYAVCEFKLTCTTLVFIVPFSSRDDRTFSNKEEFIHFWETFKHYGREGWSRTDCSDSRRVPIIYNLNFEVGNDDKAEEA